MKMRLSYAVALALFAAHAASAASWLTDISAAQAQARKEDKLILVNFTGSDWCGWCIKLRNEVFSKSEFDAFASQNLVLLEIDFPKKKALPNEVKRANGMFADKYKVSGYPTVHVLDASGKSLGQLGYMPGGPSAFLAKVKSIGGSRIKPVAATDNKFSPAEPATEAAEVEAPPAFNGAPTFPPRKYTALELKAVSGTPNKRLALINNQTLAAGESAKVRFGDSALKVQCLEVHDTHAVVMIEGSNERRELRLRGGR